MEAAKRKCDAEDAETKRTRALLDSEESDQWPVYVHPEGGTVKFSPWGSIREWVDPVTGQAGCKFEDTTFVNSTFDLCAPLPASQGYELPTTPMSLGGATPCRLSPAPTELLHYSPTSEAEQYVVEGYGQKPRRETTDQYAQEQEHYFGMDEYEEYSDNSDAMMA